MGLCLYVLAVVSAPIDAQRAGAFRGSTEDPAIKYSTAPLNNAVADVNRKLQDGAVQLTFDGRSGFLRSALDALQIPVDSQLLVFSRASLQGKQISEQNPRALFFNDRVALGWVRDGDIIEVAAHDESAGVVFYTLEQRADTTNGPPQFKRAFQCLGCHMAGDTLGVPGLLMFSTTRQDPARGFSLPRAVDHSDALGRRFGGWFVTGSAGSARHMGNDVGALDGRASRELVSVDGLFDADGYRALSSDIVAHLVFTHQVGMTNLLTRAGWQARAADPLLHPPFMPAPGEEERIALMMRGRRERGRGSPVVHRRNEADRRGPRTVWLRGAVLDARAEGPKGPLAARARPESAPHEIPVQLFDLLSSVRRAAAARQGPDLQASCGTCCRDRNATSGTCRHCRVRTVNPSSRFCGTRRRTFRTIFRTSPGRRHMKRACLALFVSLCAATAAGAETYAVRVVRDVSYLQGANYADDKDKLDLVSAGGPHQRAGDRLLLRQPVDGRRQERGRLHRATICGGGIRDCGRQLSSVARRLASGPCPGCGSIVRLGQASHQGVRRQPRSRLRHRLFSGRISGRLAVNRSSLSRGAQAVAARHPRRRSGQRVLLGRAARRRTRSRQARVGHRSEASG